MSHRTVHGGWGLYEYSLPLSDIPGEAHNAWASWLSGHIGRDADECREVLRQRFRDCSQLCEDLADRVLEYEPRSLFLYEGTPFVCLQNPYADDRFISIPPDVDCESVQIALAPYKLSDHGLLVELLALFGGLCDQAPMSPICFAGRRLSGRVVVDPAASDFEAGLEYLTDSEVVERRKRFARWLGGVQVLKGDDGEYWHVGSDGSVCWHECGMGEIGGVFDSLAEMINGFVKASSPECLFEGVYTELPGARES